VEASCDDEEMQLDRPDENTWRSGGRACGNLKINYEVYANEEGVFSSVLNDQHAYLNLATVLFYLPQERARAANVKYLLPDGWKIATLLDDTKVPGEFRAGNYDELVDSPAEAGNFREFDYGQKGARYRIVVHADPADYPAERLVDSIGRITEAATDLMEDVPFHQYTFIFHFPRSGGGGMEHRNGTAIVVSGDTLKSNWIGLESVTAHEFFHAWNVKRIRPQNLEPIDYIHGNDTRDLWFAEGVDSTFQEYILLRAGLLSREKFYERFAQAIKQLQDRPARLTQSVEESGREAWLEKYPDYLRNDRSISYYNKGQIVGFLLDLAIRHASQNQRGLWDLMRCLNSDFAKRGRFYTRQDLIKIAEGLAPQGGTFRKFFDDYVSGRRELDYEMYLGFAGLRLATREKQAAALGFEAAQGLDSLVTVISVEPGSNAYQAGLREGDILEEMNGKALLSPPGDELRGLKVGQEIGLQVKRGEDKLTVRFTLGSQGYTSYKIEEIKHPTPEQRRLRDSWLRSESAAVAGAGKP
jgi:predicted metalloprotease with PDZ domain